MVDLFRAQPEASVGPTGPTVFAPSSSAVSVFIARTIVKHLSTGPCTGKASRVEVPVALCGRGVLQGRGSSDQLHLTNALELNDVGFAFSFVHDKPHHAHYDDGGHERWQLVFSVMFGGVKEQDEKERCK